MFKTNPAPSTFRPINEVSADELQVNDAVISARGNPGIITQITQNPAKDGSQLTFHWDVQGMSIESVSQPHLWLTDVRYVGRQERVGAS